MQVMCEISGCLHNSGFGMCCRTEICISDAYTGNPACQDIEFDDYYDYCDPDDDNDEEDEDYEYNYQKEW